MTLTRVVGVAIALLTMASGAEAQKFSVGLGPSLGSAPSYLVRTSVADFAGGDRRGTGKIKVEFVTPAYGGAARSASGGRGPVYDGYAEGMVEMFSGIPRRADKAAAPALLKHFFTGDFRRWEAISEDYKKSLKRGKRTGKRQTKKPQESPKPHLRGKKSDRSSLSPRRSPPGKFLAGSVMPEPYGKFAQGLVYVPVSNGLKIGVSCKCKCKCDPKCDAYDPVDCKLCGIVYFYHDVSYKWVPAASLIEGLTRNRSVTNGS